MSIYICGHSVCRSVSLSAIGHVARWSMFLRWPFWLLRRRVTQRPTGHHEAAAAAAAPGAALGVDLGVALGAAPGAATDATAGRDVSIDSDQDECTEYGWLCINEFDVPDAKYYSKHCYL